jgi:predicted RNase H-like HicB family nuclease
MQKWRVILEHDPEVNAWAVWCPQLPGCASAGDTREQALQHIREAIETYLEVDEQPLPDRAEVHEVVAG